MKKNLSILITILCSLLLFITGCEIGTNPLILDSAIKTSIIVDQTSIIPAPIPFPLSGPVNVKTQDLRDVAGDEIEKVNFYKLTLMVDQNTTPANGLVSGRLMVNTDTLITMKDVLISYFETERSIFENIPGFEVNKKGVGTVLQAVKNPPANGLDFRLFVGPTTTPVHFRLWVKVYGQIQTTSD